jgi:hypothetical protein
VELEKPKEMKPIPNEQLLSVVLQVVQYGLWDKIERVVGASMVTLEVLLGKAELKPEQIKGDVAILLDNVMLVRVGREGSCGNRC